MEGVSYSLAESGLDQHVGALLRFPGDRIGTFERSPRHPTRRAACDDLWKQGRFFAGAVPLLVSYPILGADDDRFRIAGLVRALHLYL